MHRLRRRRSAIVERELVSSSAVIAAATIVAAASRRSFCLSDVRADRCDSRKAYVTMTRGIPERVMTRSRGVLPSSRPSLFTRSTLSRDVAADFGRIGRTCGALTDLRISGEKERACPLVTSSRFAGADEYFLLVDGNRSSIAKSA